MSSLTSAMACAIHSLQVFSSAQINVFTEEVVLRLDIAGFQCHAIQNRSKSKSKSKSLNR